MLYFQLDLKLVGGEAGFQWMIYELYMGKYNLFRDLVKTQILI